MRRKLIVVLALTMVLTVYTVNTVTTFASMAGPNAGSESGNESGNQNGSGNDEKPDISFPTSNIQAKDLIIASVTADKSVIESGSDFTITYKLENITGNKLYGVSLKIVGVEGKGTLDGFTPVGTTNEIYVGSIAANSSREVSIKLTSDSALKSGVYNFVTSVMYNKSGKEQQEIQKLSGVKISAKPQLELSGLDGWGSEMGYSVMGSLVNAGKTKVKNANVKVTVNGAEYNYAAGNIDVEGDAMFDIFIDPVTEDTVGEVEVTYEDESGNQYSTKGNCTLRAFVMDEMNSMNGMNGNMGSVDPESDSSKLNGGLWDVIKSLLKFGA